MVNTIAIVNKNVTWQNTPKTWWHDLLSQYFIILLFTFLTKFVTQNNANKQNKFLEILICVVMFICMCSRFETFNDKFGSHFSQKIWSHDVTSSADGADDLFCLTFALIVSANLQKCENDKNLWNCFVVLVIFITNFAVISVETKVLNFIRR